MNSRCKSCESVLRTCTCFHIFVNRKILFTSVLHIKVDRPISSTESPEVRSWKDTTENKKENVVPGVRFILLGIPCVLCGREWSSSFWRRPGNAAIAHSLLDYFTEAVEYPKSHQFISRANAFVTRLFWFDFLVHLVQDLVITRLQGELIGFVPLCIYRCRAKSEPPSHLFVSPFRQVTAHTKPDTILAECRVQKKKPAGASTPWISGWMTV